MNVVREINKINEKELQLGTSNSSWHDEYKDSAYIFVGGLHFDLTEGDVITIFSQYGEIMDINMPRDKETGKSKGYSFLMYEDQRSTVLAVDNLNGSKVLEKTLRVDHVRQYKQGKVKGEDGEWKEREEQSLNAKPEYILDANSESSASSGPEIDPEDPMAKYLLEKRRAERVKRKSKIHNKESLEERKARKERKRERKLRKQSGKSLQLSSVEGLLQRLDSDRMNAGKRTNEPRNRVI